MEWVELWAKLQVIGQVVSCSVVALFIGLYIVLIIIEKGER